MSLHDDEYIERLEGNAEAARQHHHRVEVERDRAREALRRYGRHDDGCEPSVRCTCGYIDALRGES